MTMHESSQRKTGLTEQDISRARNSAPLLHKKNARLAAALTLYINGKQVALPDSMTGIVCECLDLMAAGQCVAVMPVEDEIGTQEAAELLKVSRPYFVKLLDTNAIPSRKVGVQRRVKLEDVLAYKEKEKVARRTVLAELAAEGQRLKLGE